MISFNAFRKSIEGFTNTAINTVAFAELAQYGITYDTLNPTQQIALNSRGGPTVAQVQVTSQVNVPNKLTINGLEFQWVQPLDFLTRMIGVTGFGFNRNNRFGWRVLHIGYLHRWLFNFCRQRDRVACHIGFIFNRLRSLSSEKQVHGRIVGQTGKANGQDAAIHLDESAQTGSPQWETSTGGWGIESARLAGK